MGINTQFKITTMRTLKHLYLPLLLLLIQSSCKKEDVGVETIIKGHVSDNIRGINISGYKIVLGKSMYHSDLWASWTSYDEVATAYTAANGDYSITFNYKLDYDGQSYNLSEQYYGTPYYPEYLQPKIISGNTNIVNINAWAPIHLNLNLQILNNNSRDLRVRNEFNNGTYLDATENIYDQNITKSITRRTRPGSDTRTIFWYYSNGNLHEKIIPYHTPLNDLSLNLIIDCSTF